jgi:hypothetical protein
VRVTGVASAPNVVLPPWLQADREDILAALPASADAPADADHPLLRPWRRWLGRPDDAPLPPVRLLLIWDNLTGHTSAALLRWRCGHGVLPLDTPLSGSWLPRAASVPRIIVRRARAGPEPATPTDLIPWLEDTAAGWNADPTPFVWDGQRRERRRRARARRLGGSAAVAAQFHSIAA